MFGSALARMIVVSVAFVVSAAAALFVFATLGFERVTQAIYSDGGDALTSGAVLIDLLWQAYVLASALTLLPALALVLIGEMARIRSVFYYVVGGGAALAFLPLLAGLGPPHAHEPVAPAVWQVLATAGFAGGFVYWLLAGRRS
jgi:hypothetical protein